MAFYDDTDIDVMFQDFGVSVVFGVISKKGILDSAEELVQQQEGRNGVIKKASVLTIKTIDFPGLVIGSAITVNGQARVVRERLKIDDGALTKVLISV